MDADELRYLQDYRTLAEGQQDHTGAPKEMTRQQETLKTKGLFFFYALPDGWEEFRGLRRQTEYNRTARVRG